MKRLFLKIIWENLKAVITYSLTLTLPWQPSFDSHVFKTNSANTDTEGAIKRVRIKRVEIKENVRALGPGTKQTVCNNEVSVLGEV